MSSGISEQLKRGLPARWMRYFDTVLPSCRTWISAGLNLPAKCDIWILTTVLLLLGRVLLMACDSIVLVRSLFWGRIFGLVAALGRLLFFAVTFGERWLFHWGIPLIHVSLIESSLVLWLTELIRRANCSPTSTLRLWRVIFTAEDVVGHVSTGRLMNCHWSLCWPLRITRAHLLLCIPLRL